MDNNFSFTKDLNTDNNQILTEVCRSLMYSELSSDYILPENVFDAQSILMLNSTPVINDFVINGTTLEINGEVTYDILILGEDGSLNSLTFTEPFEAYETCKDMTENSVVLIKATEVDDEARLVNPRKVNVKSKTTIAVKIYTPVNVEVNVKGSETLDDYMNIQKRYSDITTATIKTTSKSDIPVSHDLELDAGYPPISEIIYSTVRLSPYEIKAKDNTLDTRIYAFSTTLYKSEEGNIFCFEKSFMIDDSENIEDADSFEWNSEISVSNLSKEIGANSYGENKIIELDFSYCMSMSGIKNESVSVVCDMYSTEYENIVKTETTDVLSMKRAYRTSLSVNASELKETLTASDARAIALDKVTVKETTAAYSNDKRKLVVSGTSNIDLVCENNVLDENDVKYIRVSFEYPFKCEIDTGDDVSSDYTVSVDVTETRHRVDSSKLYCDFEAIIRVVSTEKISSERVCMFELNKASPLTRNGTPITLCYPIGNESLWDIAKYYRTTGESIMSSNSMSDDDITDKKVLLIPSFKPKRAVISKVI